MTYCKLNDREVEIAETEFEFGEGAYVISATYVDDGTELTDEECSQLTEIYQSDLYADCFANAASRAYDLMKGD